MTALGTRPARRLAATLLAGLLVMPAAVTAEATVGARVDPVVAAFAQGATALDRMAVIVVLRDQVDPRSLRAGSTRAKRRAIVDALRLRASETQRPLAATLGRLRTQRQIEAIRPLWIINAVAMRASPGAVAELRQLPAVAAIQADSALSGPAPLSSGAPAEPNLAQVNAPAVWDLGIRGSGVVVASLDTGVDSTHPDLAAGWRGGANSWFDPYGQHASPTDVNGHGTWTMGVMVGGEAGGTGIGMAPDAHWIAAKIFNDAGVATSSAIHASFQWILDPDGNSLTDDAPDLVNNSWSFGAPGCDLSFQPDLQALVAADIVPVFAAGNFGPGQATSVSPGNYPEALSVGWVDGADQIDSQSSRGPTTCGRGGSTTFPDLVAPGTSIRSADPWSGYWTASGTSLAAPHVAGAIGLLRQAFPAASVNDLRAALLAGAADLGAAGPDDVYGSGRLDVLAAYQYLAAAPTPTPTPSPT
ncbi:MAG: S8 family serine peptidase, partial [Chloroflexota bacterium]|nr:S8 family serine peptidase [Chloroflexota bacterium]